MSDLFASLTSAARALQAQQVGLDVVGQNIANVNTAGYSRRQVVLSSVAASDKWSAGGGVEITDIRSIRDQMLEQRLLADRPAAGREEALADVLSVVETALGSSGASIDSDLDEFFDAWSDLSQDPTSSTARQAVIVQAKSLATAFNDMALRFQDARTQADNGVRSAVDDINDLVKRIAALNESIAKTGSNSPTSASLRDEQNQAVTSLSKLVDVDVLQNETGGVDISFANGRALVIGNNAYRIDIGTNSDGMTTLLSGGTDVTTEVSGGKLAGYVYARDAVIPGYSDQLDTIAYTLAQEVNALHSTGRDLNGDPGGNVFVPVASQAGAASALTVDATLTSDARRIAAATSTSPGDNTNARALANLRSAKLFSDGTGTFNDAWADLAYAVGQDADAATAEQTSRNEIVTQVEALRDAVSGVSLDEEAMLMMKFQRAYEANARYFTTIDSAIATLLDLVNR